MGRTRRPVRAGVSRRFALNPGTPAAQARELPTTLALPNDFQPEGIEIGNGTAYLGSRADGSLYRINLRTGRGEIFSKGPGTPSLGLKLDDRNRLFVSGGVSGQACVVNAKTGATVTVDFGGEPADQRRPGCCAPAR